MTPEQKRHVEYAVIGGGILLLLWWLWRRGSVLAARNMQQAATGPQSFNYNPELITYLTDPTKFGPTTVDGTVDIYVNGYNGLNQNYMPLFGFVGMAQGVVWGGNASAAGTSLTNLGMHLNSPSVGSVSIIGA